MGCDVLIVPYWNLNIYSIIRAWVYMYVLIVPYWNLKKSVGEYYYLEFKY